MANLTIESIGKLLAGDGLASISKKVRSSPAKVAKVLSIGIPVLLANMRKNVANPEGEASLGRALYDHSGKDTDHVVDFLKNVDTKDSKKILTHVLGDDQDRTAQEISRASGLSAGTVIKILSLVAPLLLSLLGNQQNQQPVQQTASPLQLLGGAQPVQQPVQQSSSLGLGNLLGGLLGLGQSQPVQQTSPLSALFGGGQQVQQPVQQQSALNPLDLISGLAGDQSQQAPAASNPALSLLNILSPSDNTPQQESASDGLLSGFLNLFR
jgi:hypothetical protein